ncbi:MAG: hypothetical protein Q4A88_09420, partial [Clostridia bacterium]|nr:hypothetical protein [Clostridia bacterium]
TIPTSIGFCPQNPEHGDKTGVTIAATPVSYPFESGIAASKQLPYEVLPDWVIFFLVFVRKGLDRTSIIPLYNPKAPARNP